MADRGWEMEDFRSKRDQPLGRLFLPLPCAIAEPPRHGELQGKEDKVMKINEKRASMASISAFFHNIRKLKRRAQNVKSRIVKTEKEKLCIISIISRKLRYIFSITCLPSPFRLVMFTGRSSLS
jgi:hypothetical protein